MSGLFEMFATGPRLQTHVVDGKAVSILYGDDNAVKQALIYGEQVLKLPAAWLSLSNTWKPLLHLSKSDVKGSTWPFLKFGTTSTTLIVPFEEIEEDKMEAMVLIVPLQFIVPHVASVVVDFLSEIREQGAFTRNRFFDDAVHVFFYYAGRQQFVKFCEKFRELRVPACLVLANQSAVASCGAAQ